ncbi:MAG: hypothetical protein ACK4N5_15040, partial [Myxococcales bacterium]
EAVDVTFDRDLLGGTRAAEPQRADDPDADDDSRVYIVGKPLDDVCDEVFVKTVRRVGSSASALGRALGQSRGAIYRRMERLGITPAGGEPREDD